MLHLEFLKQLLERYYLIDKKEKDYLIKLVSICAFNVNRILFFFAIIFDSVTISGHTHCFI